MKVTVSRRNVTGVVTTLGSWSVTTIGRQGPAGPQGEPGAGLNPRGAWDAGTAYDAPDLVEHAGSAYYTLSETTGDEPPSGPWVLLVEKGDPGADSTVPGPPGDTGATGAAATVAVGSVTTGAPGSNADVTNVGTSAAAVLNFVIPRGDVGAAGADGNDGAAGADGREVELQTSATHIQWRYEGAGSWTDLVALSDLEGPQGPAGNDGGQGPKGDSGDEVELQVTGTHIQWRLTGGSWTNLIALSDLEGPEGPASTVPGPTGADGLSAYEVAVEEGFGGDEAAWLASLVGAPGSPGTPGAAGQDGTPQWQGAWTAGTYQAGEAVSHGGSSFVANTSTSQEPPGSDWDVLAQKGDPGSGGSSAWGDLTGTLSDQTDLQNALDAKVDESSLATVATTGAYADLSGRPSLGTAAAANTGDFATAAQGGKADTALQPGDELTDLASTGVTAGHVPKADGSGGINWAAESGGGGGGGGQSVRHDNTGTFDYTGAAPVGSSESDSVWAVTRVTFTPSILIEVGTGAWDDKENITYG